MSVIRCYTWILSLAETSSNPPDRNRFQSHTGNCFEVCTIDIISIDEQSKLESKPSKNKKVYFYLHMTKIIIMNSDAISMLPLYENIRLPKHQQEITETWKINIHLRCIQKETSYAFIWTSIYSTFTTPLASDKVSLIL